MKIIKSGIFKGQTAYRSWRTKSTIDKTCPYYVEKMEGAIRSLKECPIPEDVYKRVQGIK